jgi:hypothetical protein
MDVDVFLAWCGGATDERDWMPARDIDILLKILNRF